MVTIIPNEMNITIPTTAQEVGRTGAVMAPKSFSLLKKRSAAGGGGARRALAVLGTNNAQLNMNMAKKHLAMAQEGFMKTWNFNPMKEVPLAPVRYHWSPVITPVQSEVPKDTKLLKDITNPTLISRVLPSVTPVVTDLIKSIQCDLENDTVQSTFTKESNSDNEDISDSENRIQGLSPNSEAVLVSTNSATSKSQICITEFFQPQKRKSSYHSKDSEPNTPPKKKLRMVH